MPEAAARHRNRAPDERMRAQASDVNRARRFKLSAGLFRGSPIVLSSSRMVKNNQDSSPTTLCNRVGAIVLPARLEH
jgi:hypothetical protein